MFLRFRTSLTSPAANIGTITGCCLSPVNNYQRNKKKNQSCQIIKKKGIVKKQVSTNQSQLKTVTVCLLVFPDQKYTSHEKETSCNQQYCMFMRFVLSRTHNIPDSQAIQKNSVTMGTCPLELKAMTAVDLLKVAPQGQ